MISGVLNSKKIWHENLTDLSTLPVRCSHFTLGNPEPVKDIIKLWRAVSHCTQQTFNSVNGTADSVTSTQWPVLSDQCSVTSTQWPVLSDQYSVTSTEWPVLSDQYSVTSTQWPVLSDQYSVTSASDLTLSAALFSDRQHRSYGGWCLLEVKYSSTLIDSIGAMAVDVWR